MRVLLPVLVAVAMAAGACTSTPPPTEPTKLEVGLAGSFGSGPLAHDDGLRGKLGALLASWKPSSGSVDLPFSRLLWAGRVDGSVLAVAAAKIADSDSYWVVEASGADVDHLSVSADTSFVGTHLVDSSLVPVRSSCCGQRYLASGSGVTLAGGPTIPLSDGLSDRAPVQPCRAYALSTQSGTFLDLGAGTAPLDQAGLSADGNAAVANALSGLDTCKTSTIKSAVDVAGTPAALTRLSAGPSTEVPLQGAGTITQLTWYLTTNARAASLVWRPANGSPVFSNADKAQDLQVFPLDLPGGKLVALTWSDVDATVSLPSGVTPVATAKGLSVLKPTGQPIPVVLVKAGQQLASRTV